MPELLANEMDAPYSKFGLINPEYQRYASDDDKAEYIVAVKWLKTVDLKDAVSRAGFFGNQNTVCKPRTSKWSFTVEQLKKEWHIQ